MRGGRGFSLGFWCMAEDCTRFKRGKECTRGFIHFCGSQKGGVVWGLLDASFANWFLA